MARALQEKSKTGIKRAKKAEKIFYWIMFALPLLNFLVFYVVVNFNSFLLAFKEYTLNKETLKYEPVYAGLSNFKLFFDNLFAEDSAIIVMFKNSLQVYLLGLFVGVFFALLFSYYIYKKRFMSGFFRVVLYIPSIISAVVFVTIYGYFVDRSVPSFILSVFNKEVGPLLDAYKWPTILFYNVFISFGTSVLLYSSAMSRLPDGVIEAGQIDGVNSIQEFFLLVLPLIAPTVSTFLVTGVAGLFTNEANLYVFFGYAGVDNYKTLGYYLLVLVKGKNATTQSYPYAAAAGLSLAFVAAPLTLLVKYILDKVIATVEY